VGRGRGRDVGYLCVAHLLEDMHLPPLPLPVLALPVLAVHRQYRPCYSNQIAGRITGRWGGGREGAGPGRDGTGGGGGLPEVVDIGSTKVKKPTHKTADIAKLFPPPMHEAPSFSGHCIPDRNRISCGQERVQRSNSRESGTASSEWPLATWPPRLRTSAWETPRPCCSRHCSRYRTLTLSRRFAFSCGTLRLRQEV
jgi:hypothetical protein